MSTESKILIALVVGSFIGLVWRGFVVDRRERRKRAQEDQPLGILNEPGPCRVVNNPPAIVDCLISNCEDESECAVCSEWRRRNPGVGA